jgi:hypothetical protein
MKNQPEFEMLKLYKELCELRRQEIIQEKEKKEPNLFDNIKKDIKNV